MATPNRAPAAAAIRFDQSRTLNFSAATLLVTPQFDQAQRAALDRDPKAVIQSLDQRKWVALPGWIDDLATAIVQCRHSGLTIQIKRRQNVTATLLPTAVNSPSAVLNYKSAAGAPKSLPFASSVDSNVGMLRLQIAFDQSPALYDEIFTAMTTVGSGIVVIINYGHPITVKIPAPVGRPTTPRPRPIIVRPGVFRPVLMRAPAAAPIAAVQPKSPVPPHVAAVSPAVSKKLGGVGGTVREVPGDIGRFWIHPTGQPQGDRLERHDYGGLLSFPLSKPQSDTTVFPDLPRQARNGWDQVPQSPGASPLLFRDSGKIDTFFYIPTSFKLGFYQQPDGATSEPPMRVEVYQNTGGSQRIRVTLVALPFIQDDERSHLRTYLHDQVLQKLQPFIYLEMRSGLVAEFVEDFTSGTADNAHSLPVEIQFKALDLVANDRIKLQFDMPADQYAIFCNMLLFGIYGRVKLSEPQFQAELPVRLHLEDMTSNLLAVNQVAPQNDANGKLTPATLSVENRLSYPVTLNLLSVNLLDRGSESGMILDSETFDLSPPGGQLAPQSQPAASATFKVEPERLVGWDSTVVEPGAVKVSGGKAQDWLDRINRDPSLQPHEFAVQLQLLAADAIRPQVQLVRVRLFKDGDSAVRTHLDIPVAMSQQTLQVTMTLAELMGEAGKAPDFSIEYETLAADGSLSPTQRVAVAENVSNLQLRAMVPTPQTIYTLDQDGAMQDIARADLDAMIPQLRSQEKHWEIFTREPASQTTTTTTTTTAAPQQNPNPAVSVITDLAALKLQDGTLSRIFVVLKADRDDAPQSSFALDAQHHDTFTWQPQGLTVPPFRWDITYLYANGQVKQAKGVSSDLTLILDPQS
jgi:hypothetical protein